MSETENVYKVALAYIESQYEGNAREIEDCLHPRLAKRTVVTDEKRQRHKLDELSALEMVQLTRKGALANTPPEEQVKDVTVLSMYRDIASVRVESHFFVDYLHLAKFNDHWVVVNALWCFTEK